MTAIPRPRVQSAENGRTAYKKRARIFFMAETSDVYIIMA
jgi:hypothetical protein